MHNFENRLYCMCMAECYKYTSAVLFRLFKMISNWSLLCRIEIEVRWFLEISRVIGRNSRKPSPYGFNQLFPRRAAAHPCRWYLSTYQNVTASYYINKIITNIIPPLQNTLLKIKRNNSQIGAFYFFFNSGAFDIWIRRQRIDFFVIRVFFGTVVLWFWLMISNRHGKLEEMD